MVWRFFASLKKNSLKNISEMQSLLKWERYWSAGLIRLYTAAMKMKPDLENFYFYYFCRKLWTHIFWMGSHTTVRLFSCPSHPSPKKTYGNVRAWRGDSFLDSLSMISRHCLPLSLSPLFLTVMTVRGNHHHIVHNSCTRRCHGWYNLARLPASWNEGWKHLISTTNEQNGFQRVYK